MFDRCFHEILCIRCQLGITRLWHVQCRFIVLPMLSKRWIFEPFGRARGQWWENATDRRLLIACAGRSDHCIDTPVSIITHGLSRRYHCGEPERTLLPNARFRLLLPHQFPRMRKQKNERLGMTSFPLNKRFCGQSLSCRWCYSTWTSVSTSAFVHRS